jgi:hypothetical protein
MFFPMQTSSHRLLHCLPSFVDLSHLPSAACEWEQLEELRASAYDMPSSHVLLCGQELEAYRQPPAHTPSRLEQRLGLPLARRD